MTNEALLQIVPFILIFIVFYFLLIRPQQKKQKEHQEKLKNIRRGDTVITQGGVYGSVHKIVDDTKLEVKIADGVIVKLARSFVADVVSKTGDSGQESAENTANDAAADGENGVAKKLPAKKSTAKKTAASK